MRAHAFSAGVIHAHSEFKKGVDAISANRLTDKISDVANEAFTRDLSGAD